ncbi:LA2681 family HEPN domain-containing protein [Spirochaeta isovalerica]|uniref:Tetratricopeptide (TPR) repeat protein n=1 Tax=Spirochaeta isovalerica TaxID=150 RepID=A0A841RCS2_9SPIO|nr:LA2681 family HEPN domain-containing protein [Spirochaeta isovalerica]MBB6480790.1 tetratricopeptide (TPR) repeat protein [Spirochaeta isovalerica]
MGNRTFREKLGKAHELTAAGKYREALALIIDEEVSSVRELFNKIAILIDAGFALRDEKVLRYGIYLFEEHHSEIIVLVDYRALVYYNLANQYANMATLKSFDNDYYSSFSRSELQKAKHYYYLALESEKIGPDLKRDIYIGLANCFRTLGRFEEALENYNATLAVDPSSITALDNKTELMIGLSSLYRDRRDEILKESWDLIGTVMDREDAVMRKDVFDKSRTRIQKLINRKAYLEEEQELPNWTLESSSDLEHFYITWCVKNKLYLNLCNFCRKCDYAAGDYAVIRKEDISIAREDRGRFLRLSSAYNQLKAEYVGARFLLIMSRYDDFDIDFVNTMAPMIEIPGKEPLDIKESLLDQSFLSLWRIWDGIAAFLNIYAGLNIQGHIRIRDIWHRDGDVKKEIIEKKDLLLNAVYDIYCDMYQGRFEKLPLLFEILSGNRNIISKAGSVEDLDREALTIELFQVVRHVLMILMQMLDSEENDDSEFRINFPLYSFEIPDAILL